MKLVRVFGLGVFAGYLIWSGRGKEIFRGMRSAADRRTATRASRQRTDAAMTASMTRPEPGGSFETVGAHRPVAVS